MHVETEAQTSNKRIAIHLRHMLARMYICKSFPNSGKMVALKLALRSQNSGYCLNKIQNDRFSNN